MTFPQILTKIDNLMGKDLAFKNQQIIKEVIHTTRDIKKLRTINLDLFTFIINGKKMGFTVRKDKMELYSFDDMESYKNLYNYNSMNYNNSDSLNDPNEIIENYNNIMASNKDISFTELVKQFTPLSYSYFQSKFDFKSKELKEQFTNNIYDLLSLIILKGFPQFENLNIQKYILIYGPGASGKSELVNLFKAFIDDSKVFNGEFSDLGGRFETSYMSGKSLISFSDENMSFEGNKNSKKGTILKKLTGGDSIRAEIKFEGTFSFINKGLVVVTSNNTTIVKGSDYIAHKRRTYLIPITKTINKLERNSNVFEEVIKKEFISLLIIALTFSPNPNDLVKRINLWDTEIKLINHREVKLLEDLTDPFTAFLESTVELDNDSKNKSFIS